MKFKSHKQRKAVMSRLSSKNLNKAFVSTIALKSKERHTVAKKPVSHVVEKSINDLNKIKKQTKDKKELAKIDKLLSKAKELKKTAEKLNKLIKKKGLTEQDLKEMKRLQQKFRNQTTAMAGIGSISIVGSSFLSPITSSILAIGSVYGLLDSFIDLSKTNRDIIKKKIKFKKEQL